MSSIEDPVLIVDDDPEITSALSRGLALHGLRSVSENRVDTALERFADTAISAAIIDVMIGSDSGIDLVRNVRNAGHRTPILMLSALSEVEDRARGLEAGADDYVVKPFSFDELVARLKVQQRRARPDKPRATLDMASWILSTDHRRVDLTEREVNLLALLSRHAGTPLSREMVFAELWASQGASSENVVDVYVGYLRRKLDPAQEFGFEIKTIRNQGFMLDGTAPKISQHTEQQ